MSIEIALVRPAEPAPAPPAEAVAEPVPPAQPEPVPPAVAEPPPAESEPTSPAVAEPLPAEPEPTSPAVTEAVADDVIPAGTGTAPPLRQQSNALILLAGVALLAIAAAVVWYVQRPGATGEPAPVPESAAPTPPASPTPPAPPAAAPVQPIQPSSAAEAPAPAVMPPPRREPPPQGTPPARPPKAAGGSARQAPQHDEWSSDDPPPMPSIQVNRPPPARLTPDELYARRAASECESGFMGFACREKVRIDVCRNRWNDGRDPEAAVCFRASLNPNN